jgi:transcriptional regulator with XRE-family HTH domain
LRATKRSAGEAGTLVGPTIRRYRLGTELRGLREARGHRLEDVAAKLGVAPSTLSRIETGKAPTRTSYINTMLDFYEVDDPQQRRYLADLAREGQRKGWWADYDDLLPCGGGSFLDLEAAATKMCTFALQTIPSLLQTADYATAYVRADRPNLSAGQIEALVTVTMRRQQLCGGRRILHAIIDQSALLRTLGSEHVMAGQFDFLASACANPLMTIQVLPLAAPAQILCPSFTVMTFTAPLDTEVGCRSEHDDHVTVINDGDAVRRLRSMFAKLSRHSAPAADSARLINEMRKK